MVDAAGRFAVASVFPHTRMSQVAEATGILAALHSAPAGRPIHILSDSLNTIALVRTAVRVGFPAGVDARFDMASAIVETCTARPTTTVIHWVKAHTVLPSCTGRRTASPAPPPVTTPSNCNPESPAHT
jgi:hypothetical protein